MMRLQLGAGIWVNGHYFVPIAGEYYLRLHDERPMRLPPVQQGPVEECEMCMAAWKLFRVLGTPYQDEWFH